MLKKLFLCFAAVVLLTALLCIGAQARDVIDSGMCGDALTWTLYDDGELVIGGYGEMWDYFSASYTIGYVYSYSYQSPIFREGSTAPWSHYYYSFVKTLSILEGVTSIGQFAFSGCSGFTGDLMLPDSVTAIGDAAFWGCSGFTGDLTLPNSVTTIGNTAFYSCHFTGSLILPNSVTTIYNAFSNCSFTGSLIIPNSVTTIGNDAFSNCSFAGDLILPNSVTTIGNNAFSNCSFTGSLIIPNSVTTIGNNAFSYCSFTGDLTLPNSLKYIGSCAFYSCSALGNLIIPDSVRYIGFRAFYGCSQLSSVLFQGRAPVTFEDEVFGSCADGFTIYYRAGNAGWTSPAWNGYPAEVWAYDVTGVTLNRSAASLPAGTTLQLTAEVAPATALNRTVVWSSSAPAVASVDTNGLVTARTAGTAVITAATADGGKTASCAVTVTRGVTITQQPHPQTVTAGARAVFRVYADGDALTYQWFYLKPGEADWTPVITNGTSASYTIYPQVRHDGYLYRCLVSSGAVSVMTESALLTVTASAPALSITQQPQPQTVAAGASASFSVTAAGEGLTYQWYCLMPGAADWTPVTAGGTSAVYTFAAQASQNGYVYRCRVSSGSVSVDSEAAALTVTASAAAVVITQNPQAQTVTAGSRATFSVAATGNDLTYQWYYLKPGAADWSPVITNGTSATYRLTAMARHNGYIYKCRVSSGSEYAESDTALLTVG